MDVSFELPRAPVRLAALVATPVWWFVAKRFGKRPTYFLSLGLAALMTVPAMLLPAPMAGLMLIVLLVSGVVDASNQLMPNAMVPDTVEVDQARTGVRREGALFGAWGLCRKLGMTAGAWTVVMAYLRCPHAAPMHCIVAHVVPTLILTALGAVLGWLLLRVKVDA